MTMNIFGWRIEMVFQLSNDCPPKSKISQNETNNFWQNISFLPQNPRKPLHPPCCPIWSATNSNLNLGSNSRLTHVSQTKSDDNLNSQFVLDAKMRIYVSYQTIGQDLRRIGNNFEASFHNILWVFQETKAFIWFHSLFFNYFSSSTRAVFQRFVVTQPGIMVQITKT